MSEALGLNGFMSSCVVWGWGNILPLIARETCIYRTKHQNERNNLNKQCNVVIKIIIINMSSLQLIYRGEIVWVVFGSYMERWERQEAEEEVNAHFEVVVSVLCGGWGETR